MSEFWFTVDSHSKVLMEPMDQICTVLSWLPLAR